MDPRMFGEAPARDARFTVVERWADCVNLPDDHPEKQLEFLHRQMNEELNVLENAARSLAEFTDAPWKLRMSLARQCADEARHTATYKRLVESRGGRVGRYPVMNFQYRILGKIDSLVGRLAVQNRSFEAEGLDAVTHAIEEARSAGDLELMTVYQVQQADEVLHIRFANDFIRSEVQREPRTLLHMASALTQGERAFKQVFADGGMHVTKYGVAETERLEAGFAPGEIRVAAEQSRERIAAVHRGDV